MSLLQIPHQHQSHQSQSIITVNTYKLRYFELNQTIDLCYVLTGNNYIAVNFGATLELNEKDIDNAENLIKDSKVLVTSMVVRDKTALHALKLGKKNNCKTNFV